MALKSGNVFSVPLAFPWPGLKVSAQIAQLISHTSFNWPTQGYSTNYVQVGIVMQIPLCEWCGFFSSQSYRKVALPCPCLMTRRQKTVQGEGDRVVPRGGTKSRISVLISCFKYKVQCQFVWEDES